MRKGKEKWITTGYTEFAIYGPAGVNVDRLSGLVHKSRSSFYHNFGDKEGFEDALFDYHKTRTLEFEEAIRPLKDMFPDYAEMVVKFKDWVFFHRQMFLLQFKDKRYADVFNRTIAVTGPKSAELWCKEARLCNVPKSAMENFFVTVRDVFFTRIDYNSFTVENYTRVVKDLNQTFSFLLEKDTAVKY